ncbi:MAG TPA: hypothetical protein DDE71_09875 [Tenacibaculum sp.]|nr:hypothetical protein [Tenacibaculum sp.]
MRSLLIILIMLFGFLTTSCSQRVVVKRPAKYKVVRVKGKKYYFWKGRYHKRTSRGYVVVKI